MSSKKPIAPMTIEQKIEAGLQMGLNSHPSFEDSITWIKNITIEYKNADAMDGGNFRTTGRGKVGLTFKRKTDGAMLMPKEGDFEIVVEDTKDAWGLPTIKVVSCKVSNLELMKV